MAEPFVHGVEDVAVVGLPEPSRGEEVVAAIVASPGIKIDLEAVREHAAKRLSRYALPRALVVLETLPHSQIGKVIRRSVRDVIMKARLDSEPPKDVEIEK